MGYLLCMMLMCLMASAIVMVASYDDAKRYGGIDRKILRYAVIAFIASPLAGFWFPVTVIVLIVYGLYRAFRVAFTGGN